MRILMISPEGPPLARATALTDMLEALPRELRARGHEVALVLPYYREIRENESVGAKETGITVDVQVGARRHVAEYLEARTAGGVQIFFVRCDEFFDRTGIYGERGENYEDNATRFIFFSKAAMELVRRMTPSPQLLHVFDWATALVPVLAHHQRLPVKTVLTIQHLAEQGSFWGLDFSLTNLPERFFSLHGLEFFGRMNLLKGGILHADRITTASEHYAQEIRTPEGGHGLDVVLRENGHRLVGILGGADYRRWDPSVDHLIPEPFGPGALRGKATCRAALLAEMNLAPDPAGPVFGMVTRTVREKGLDVLMPVMDRLLSDDVRLVILGAGDPEFETALAINARKYPTKFTYLSHYDERLAHLIEAGVDVTLIPSLVEPSGVSAMYSLKYGALPVARTTGGIQEIIEDYDPTAESGYGFLYYDSSVEAFWDAIKRAREIYCGDPEHWAALVGRAMSQTFAWEAAAESYEQVYRQLTGGSRAAA